MKTAFILIALSMAMPAYAGIARITGDYIGTFTNDCGTFEAEAIVRSDKTTEIKYEINNKLVHTLVRRELGDSCELDGEYYSCENFSDDERMNFVFYGKG